MSTFNSVGQRGNVSVRILGIGLAFLLILLALASASLSIPPQISNAQNSTSFASSFESLVKKANTLSQSYHNATEKAGKDNKTIIAITDSYQPKYQSLIDESKSLQPPQQFQNATSLYTKSLETELQSNNHLRNSLATNNSTESKLSSKLLSDSFNYEIEAFKQLKASGLFKIVP